MTNWMSSLALSRLLQLWSSGLNFWSCLTRVWREICTWLPLRPRQPSKKYTPMEKYFKELVYLLIWHSLCKLPVNFGSHHFCYLQPTLRPIVTELVSSARQLYEESCELLRDKAHHLVNWKLIMQKRTFKFTIFLTFITFIVLEIERRSGEQIINLLSNDGTRTEKVCFRWKWLRIGVFAKSTCRWTGKLSVFKFFIFCFHFNFLLIKMSIFLVG